MGKFGVGVAVAIFALNVGAGAPAAGYTPPAPGVVKMDPSGPVTPLPDVNTDAYVLADADSGAILVSRSANAQMRPASTLKTLTMLTLLPQLKQDGTYTASVADDEAEGSEVGLIPGKTYKIRDLFAGLALPSGNDAAEGLARANGGLEKTVDQMNAEAARIGASDTHAVNPSGLDGEGQYSSAADLAQIFRVGLTEPAFVHLVGTETYSFPDRANGGTVELYTQDKLVTHDYPGIIGGKTGYTTEAGRTFVAAAKQNGHTLVVSLLRIGGNTEKTATQLLDWGFANYDHLRPVGKLPPLPYTSVDVHGAQVSTPQAVHVEKLATVEGVPTLSWLLGSIGACVGLVAGVVAYWRGWM